MTILAHGTEFNHADRAHPERVARKIEGLFLQILTKELRRTLPKDSWLSGGFAGSMIADLFDQAIAGKAGESMNLGLADSLCAQLGLRDAPLPVAGRITSPYGPRKDPITGKISFHHGLDIGAAAGSVIHAVRGGTVVKAGSHGNLGNAVRVRGSDGTVVTYGHCGRIFVRSGQALSKGARLAEVGKTGRTTGPHLHLEVRRQKRSIDPQRWMRLETQDFQSIADDPVDAGKE